MQENNAYKTMGSKLLISGTVIIFDCQIKEVIEICDMLIVLILKKSRITPNRNVFGVSISKKEIIWQIEKLFPTEDNENCPFVGIRKYQ